MISFLNIFSLKLLFWLISYSLGENQWELPFPSIAGERLEHTCLAQENYVVLTNFRLIVCLPDTFYNVSVTSTFFDQTGFENY